jgi:death on curing protein
MRWLRLDAVLAIHRRQIAEHGGDGGVRDIGLLESALNRPQNTLAYEPGSDLARLAASLAFGIARNHLFIDGNKRTALVVTRTFLILNGYDLEVDQSDKYLKFIALAEGTLLEEELASWLRAQIYSLK